ncbi:hypothetical protein EJ05DRAFT_507173 [Pseudovirgaria hyperparasitica]|uniref:Uncharacterized protein n=1 Tax=Pseudovirgaria hyperparasitica TaxID=470096 RepID=A0A6A6WH19_9PEZI|nr:uncharacterized protein EJ05DRAFT_507173 [Pseudovirgaria hyperparasitica]KAF2761509.1 hypothetical protein EJ05DRAFT_507173 [Pseudovirgaria hyperparasitica]
MAYYVDPLGRHVNITFSRQDQSDSKLVVEPPDEPELPSFSSSVKDNSDLDSDEHSTSIKDSPSNFASEFAAHTVAEEDVTRIRNSHTSALSNGSGSWRSSAWPDCSDDGDVEFEQGEISIGDSSTDFRGRSSTKAICTAAIRNTTPPPRGVSNPSTPEVDVPRCIKRFEDNVEAVIALAKRDTEHRRTIQSLHRQIQAQREENDWLRNSVVIHDREVRHSRDPFVESETKRHGTPQKQKQTFQEFEEEAMPAHVSDLVKRHNNEIARLENKLEYVKKRKCAELAVHLSLPGRDLDEMRERISSFHAEIAQLKSRNDDLELRNRWLKAELDELAAHLEGMKNI